MIRPEWVTSSLIVTVLACSGTGSLPEPAPHVLRGIEMLQPFTVADSVNIAAYGEVVAVVRADAIVLIMNADSARLEALPGVRIVGQVLGTSDNVPIEVEMGVGPAPTDSAVAILSAVGTLKYRFDSIGIVDGFVAAKRLNKLNDYPAITFLLVAILLPHQA